MIQFNLLPDVKLEFIKAQRLKRSVLLISTLVGSASLAIVVLLFLGVSVFQKNHLNDLSADINTDSKKLHGIQDLDKILTVQNQLTSLTQLHDQKNVASRLPTFLQTVTPANVSIANVTVDFTTQAITITGAADKISTVNKYVDTLKFAQYTIAGSDTKLPAFSAVVLSSFGRDDKGSSYTITLKYDKPLFDETKDVTLTVPDIITTRSETEKPVITFQPLSNTKAEQ